MDARLRERIAVLLSAQVAAAAPLGGGCVAEVLRVELGDGRSVVAKVSGRGGLECEGWMLGYLAARSRLPVPAVLFCDENLLLLEYIESDGNCGADLHAAELLAALHSIQSDGFGLERETPIGGLPQPNEWSKDWLSFFRDRRLLEFGRRAFDAGRLGPSTLARVETLAARLDQWLGSPARGSLIHGDVWQGNVLARAGRVAAFVDPAIYYADPEIELAFTTLFSTFGQTFYSRYHELRPIAPGFFEERAALYNLYPLLVHTLLFGGSYAHSVDSTLRRFVG
ncbi:MAG: fructosamine kinase family protein [Deltaproteobacteria bacterium]|nr:fructosamine kinase family protein [Deltaproteobacteria bacterium]